VEGHSTVENRQPRSFCRSDHFVKQEQWERWWADDGGASAPSEARYARSTIVPRGWGLGRDAAALPQYGDLGDIWGSGA